MRHTSPSVILRQSTARLRPTPTALITRSLYPKTHFGAAFSCTSRATATEGGNKAVSTHEEFGVKEVVGKGKGKEVEGGVERPLNNNQSVRSSPFGL